MLKFLLAAVEASQAAVDKRVVEGAVQLADETAAAVEAPYITATKAVALGSIVDKADAAAAIEKAETVLSILYYFEMFLRLFGKSFDSLSGILRYPNILLK